MRTPSTRNEEILIFTSVVPAALFLGGGKFIKDTASVIIPRVGRAELASGTTPRNGAVNCTRHATALRRFRSPTAHHEHPDVCSSERAPGPAGGWESEHRDDARGDCLRLRPGHDRVSEIPRNDSELRAWNQDALWASGVSYDRTFMRLFVLVTVRTCATSRRWSKRSSSISQNDSSFRYCITWELTINVQLTVHPWCRRWCCFVDNNRHDSGSSCSYDLDHFCVFSLLQNSCRAREIVIDIFRIAKSHLNKPAAAFAGYRRRAASTGNIITNKSDDSLFNINSTLRYGRNILPWNISLH